MSEILLTKAQILEVDDSETRIVDVPEWGGKVRVRGLTGSERDKFEASQLKQQGKSIKYDPENVKARLAAYSIIDENGNRIFSDADIIALGKKSAKALNRVADVARELSGFTDKDMEELTKNSEATTSEDSPSV